MSKIYKLSEFSGADFAEQVKNALAAVKKDEGATLIVEPGEYVLTTELAREAQAKVMSGEWGENPQDVMFTPEYKYSIGFDFSGHKGTKVIGYGVKLMMDGFMEIFSMSDCEDVTVEGFTVDYKRKPFSVGKVEKCVVENENSAYIDIRLYDEYPVQEKTPLDMRYFIYNPETSRLEWPGLYAPKGEFVSENLVRYRGERLDRDITGLDYYIWHTYHSRPVVLMQRAKNVTVRNMTVHCHAGMGVTGNRTENILLDGFRDVPAEGLHVSTNTDATHFTACTGQIKVINCSFIGQGDDAINVHGYYHRVISADGNRYTVRNDFPDGISHTQTPDYPDIGDVLEINDKNNLRLLGTRKVVEVKQSETDGRICELVLDEPLTDEMVESQVRLFDVTRLPELHFAHCYCYGNFARGVLAKTRGIHVYNNVFENTMGVAVNIYAEPSWSEGTNPADVLICNNVMRNCAYLSGKTKYGAIQVGVHAKDHPGIPLVKNVTIRDNYMDCPDAEYAIEAESIDGLEIKNNTNVSSQKMLKCFDCANIDIE